MIWLFWIGVVAVAGIIHIVVGRFLYGFAERVSAGLLIALGVAFAGLLSAIIIGAFLPLKWQEEKTEPLVEVAACPGADGKKYFVDIVRGAKDKQYVRFFRISKMPLGGYYLGELSGTGQVFISEEKREDGVLVTETARLPGPVYELFFFSSGGTRHTFRVPEGSVLKERRPPCPGYPSF